MSRAHQEPTVLVADDDADMRDHVRQCLRPLTRRVLLAADGREALETAEEHRPDLVIADLRMPGMGGRELARRLPLDPHGDRLPVLFLTGEDDARLDGPVLRKPFSARTLRAFCRALLERVERRADAVTD